MKVTHIVAIVVIALAIGMIIATMGDASQYLNFSEAKALAKSGDTRKIHIVGKLKKDNKGNILEANYNAQANPNLFVFTLVDSKNEAQTVVFNSPKPADFDRSEQIVVIGSYRNDRFVADKILMKCPSKYQENTLEVKEAQASQGS